MKRAAFAILLLAAAVLFAALGVWQVQRLAWKKQLIATTQHNLTATPVPAPAPAQWPAISPSSTYIRITATGTYLPVSPTLVLASTRYGRGYWVMAPLRSEHGFTVLINRGFVTPAQRASLATPSSTVTITGLLRLPEPGGSLLQRNVPGQGRWYSRDVAAIAASQNLGQVAPYFMDADASGTTPPIGGLTVVTFRNNHLQYALTWFTLALLAMAGLGVLVRQRL